MICFITITLFLLEHVKIWLKTFLRLAQKLGAVTAVSMDCSSDPCHPHHMTHKCLQVQLPGYCHFAGHTHTCTCTHEHAHTQRNKNQKLHNDDLILVFTYLLAQLSLHHPGLLCHLLPFPLLSHHTYCFLRGHRALPNISR